MNPPKTITPVFDYSEVKVVRIRQGGRMVYRHTCSADAMRRWKEAEGFVVTTMATNGVGPNHPLN